jgi:hypothetical protein
MVNLSVRSVNRAGRLLLAACLSLLFLWPAQAAADGVVSLTLIDADRDRPIAGFDPLPAGAVVNLAALPTRNLNIRANTSPSTVGSVKFGLDGNASYRVENGAPYALAGDDGGDYRPWTPTPGTHTVTATPYTKSGAGGTAGTSLRVTFSVVDAAPTVAAVTSFTLINADTDAPIAQFDPLTAATLDLATLPTRRLSIRANTSPSVVGSVVFDLNSSKPYQTESALPYAIAGDDDGDYNPWTPAPGTYVLTGTPYSEPAGGGTAGTALTVTFTVTDSGTSSDGSSGSSTGSTGSGDGGDLVDSGPITIDGKSNVTISGRRIRSSSGPCITIKNASSVRIEGNEIGPCGGHGIQITASKSVVIVRNDVHTEKKAVAGGAYDRQHGLYMTGTVTDVLVDGNRFWNNESSIVGMGSGVKRLIVRENYSLNPRGPFPRGQHVQCWGCNEKGSAGNGVTVEDNFFDVSPEREGTKNTKDGVGVEDAINLGKCHHCVVRRNYIRGGAAHSGCGILFEYGATHALVEDNVLYRTSQCGINIVRSPNALVQRNFILDPNVTDLGDTTAGNVGIAFYSPSSTDTRCRDGIVRDNVVSNRRADGTFADIWVSKNCTNITQGGNVKGSTARPRLTPVLNRKTTESDRPTDVIKPPDVQSPF